jgi:hypothetical protein
MQKAGHQFRFDEPEGNDRSTLPVKRQGTNEWKHHETVRLSDKAAQWLAKMVKKEQT